MDERDFSLLNVLAETKNITKASEQLYLTQSALSKRIAGLEKELNISLLIRSRQGVHFTAEGETILKYTQQAATLLKEMRTVIEQNQGQISGTLNVGVSINYALYHLPEMLAQYRKKYPHVTTNIKSEHNRYLFLQLLEGELDLAILRGDFPWKEHKILLEQEQICAIIHPQHQHKNLNEIPFIRRKTDAVFERDLNQWLREQQIELKESGICVDNIETCVEMVNKGLGWAVVPKIALSQFKGEIRPLVFQNTKPFVRSTYLMYNDRALHLPQAKAFIEMVEPNVTLG